MPAIVHPDYTTLYGWVGNKKEYFATVVFADGKELTGFVSVNFTDLKTEKHIRGEAIYQLTKEYIDRDGLITTMNKIKTAEVTEHDDNAIYFQHTTK